MSKLTQIPGVTGPILELLKAAGIESLEDMTATPAKEILARLAEANDARPVVAELPSAQAVSAWQRSARTLEETKAAGQLPSMAAAGGPADSRADLKTASIVSAKELQKSGISVDAVPIARLLDEEKRPLAAARPAVVVERTPRAAKVERKLERTGAEPEPRVEGKRFRSLEEAGKPSPRSQRRNPGMSHHSPVTVWIAAGAAMLSQLLFLGGLVGTAAVFFMMRDGPGSVPRWAIGVPALIPLALIIFAMFATQARCRLCGQRVFVPKKCLKHVKADRSIFGYVFASALRAFFLRNFRCQFCGTKIRLSRKSLREEANRVAGNP